MTFPSVAVYASAPAARCIPLASVMGIEPIGRWVWRPDRPPGRTLYDSFLTGESDPVWTDGHPIAERVVRRGRTNPDRRNT